MGEERSASEVDVEDTDDDNVFNTLSQAESASQYPKSAIVIASIAPSSVKKACTIAQAESNIRSSPISQKCPTIVMNPRHNSLTPNQIYSQYLYPKWGLPLKTSLPDSDRIEEAIKQNPLSVYCNAQGGAKIWAKFDKDGFASGSRGKCIEHNGKFLTPSEFEKTCNLANSRDWRRSIHYQGDQLKMLIKNHVIRPHAQSCVCKICSPETSTSSAPKYEDEVKRKRTARESTASEAPNTKRLCHPIDFASCHFFPQRFFPEPRAKALSMPADSNRVPDEFDLLEAKMELNRQERAQFEADFLKVNNQMEVIIGHFQELKQRFSDQMTAHDETEKLCLAALANCRGRFRSRSNDDDNVPCNLLVGTPKSAPADYLRRKMNNFEKRRTSSDTCGQFKCSNEICIKRAHWRCRGCSRAIYCSKPCQEQHWTNGHEDECDSDE